MLFNLVLVFINNKVSPVLNRLAVVQDLNPEVDKPGKRKKLDAGARAGSEDKDAGICICILFVFVFVLSARAGSEDKDAGTCERDAD